MNNVKEYLNLPYNYIIQRVNNENGYYYYTRVLELDGCQSTGETLEAAFKNIKEAIREWIEEKQKMGLEIPIPIDMKGFTGKFIIKMPKSLEYRLNLEAKKEEVSLNQYIIYKLSK